MARIPDEAINRIKQDVSLQRIVEDYGIALKISRQRPDGVMSIPR